MVITTRLMSLLKKSKITKNKDGKTIILYTNDPNEQHSFVKSATDKGYEVLELGGPLMSHLIFRSDNTDYQFARVDADVIDKLIEKEEQTTSKLSEKEQEKLKKIFEDTVDKEKFTVQLQNICSRCSCSNNSK